MENPELDRTIREVEQQAAADRHRSRALMLTWILLGVSALVGVVCAVLLVQALNAKEAEVKEKAKAFTVGMGVLLGGLFVSFCATLFFVSRVTRLLLGVKRKRS